jgi:hypothetical protein
MAIDTASKRRRVLGFGRPGAILPAPDGSIDAEDRAGLAGVYYTGGAPVPPVPPSPIVRRGGPNDSISAEKLIDILPGVLKP